MSHELPSDAPAPRLCHLVKWPDFDGYGFNLHAEKAKSGQFIGKVDDDSPADHAALKEGDRIIEVNGVNIANENHRQVVERIKAVPNETKLLVLDDEADRWYKERKLVVKSTQANVRYVKTPVPRPTGGISPVKPISEENVSAVISNGNSSAQHSETQSLADSSRSSTPKTEPKRDDSSARSTPSDSPRPQTPPVHAVVKAQNGNTPKSRSGAGSTNGNSSNGSTHSATPPPVAKDVSAKTTVTKEVSAKTTVTKEVSAKTTVTKEVSAKTTVNKEVSAKTPVAKEVSLKTEVKNQAEAVKSATNGSSKAPLEVEKAPSANGNGAVDGAKSAKGGKAGGELNFNMSAAQMREMLASRKKADPKKQSMDMREKYQIVQQM